MARPPATTTGVINRPTPAAPAEAGTTHAAKPRLVMTREAFFSEHPEAKGIMERDRRRNMLWRVEPAIDRLNLTDEQRNRVKDLYVEIFMSAFDAQQLLAGSGIKPNDPNYQAAYRAAIDGVTNEIKSIVGPDAYQTLSDYSRAQPYRQELQRTYAVDFSEARAPLTPDQVDRLSQLMSHDLGQMTDWNRNPNADGEQKVLTDAATFLSPTQIELLRQRWADEHQLRAYQQQYPGLQFSD